MKSTQIQVKSAWRASVAFMFLYLITSSALSQDVPKLISYQGMLQQHGINVNGEQVIRLTLYSDLEGQNIVWRGSYKVDVKDGIFSVLLGSGKYRLPEVKEMDKPLYLGVALQGEDELRPLTRLSASAYSLNIADKSVTMDKLSEEIYELLTKHPRDGEIQAGADWNSSGNNTSGLSDTLGSKDGNWKLITHNKQIVKYQLFSGSNHPDILGGWSGDPNNPNQYPGNSITSGTFGSNVIAGGGILSAAHSDGSPNEIHRANFSYIGGGARNYIGDTNEAYPVFGVTIGGGSKNRALHNYATIAGGRYGHIFGEYSVIGGGFHNTIEHDTIDLYPSVIPGGRYLKIGRNSFGFNGNDDYDHYLDLSTQPQIAVFNDVHLLLGNIDNNARELRFFEPSNYDTLYSNANYTAFKSGSQPNNITYTLPLVLPNTPTGSILILNNNVGQMAWLPPSSDGKVLKMNGTTGLPEWGSDSVGSGGVGTTYKWYKESTANPLVSPLATDTGAVAHGENVVASGKYSTIGGGRNDTASGLYSVIGGGLDNIVSSFIGTIAGGDSNQVKSFGSTISGGRKNLIQVMTPNTQYAFIPDTTINMSDYPVLDSDNKDTLSAFSTISGGYTNIIETDSFFSKASTISGGALNAIKGLGGYSSIGGGVGNQILEAYATIPGGKGLTAASLWQTVIGTYNIPKGALSNYPPYDLLGPYEAPLLIVGNGLNKNERSNAFEVSYLGYSTVFHENNIIVKQALDTTNEPIKGSTYTDNVIYAWGKIPTPIQFQQASPCLFDCDVSCTFGTVSAKLRCIGGNVWLGYEITVRIVDPAGNLVHLNCGSVVVTPIHDQETEECLLATVSPITSNSEGDTFQVKIKRIIPGGCEVANAPFYFMVTGRPN